MASLRKVKLTSSGPFSRIPKGSVFVLSRMVRGWPFSSAARAISANASSLRRKMARSSSLAKVS